MRKNLESAHQLLPSIYIYILCIFNCFFYMLVLIRCAKLCQTVHTHGDWHCENNVIASIQIFKNEKFKLTMAMTFFADLMWDVDSKKALNSDDAEIVLMMVEMLRLDSLHDIKLEHEQNVVLHVPYSPCLLLPNRLQWSFSIYFVDSETNNNNNNIKTWITNFVVCYIEA